MMLRDRHLTALDRDVDLLGRLGPAERAEVEAHLAACERCREERQVAEQAADRFTREVCPRTLPVVRARRGRARVRLLVWPALAATATIAVALLLVARRPEPEQVLALKGPPSFKVYARRGGRVFAVEDGARLAAGDALRFAGESSRMPYLLVVSVDGAANTHVYFPYRGLQSGSLGAGPRFELPGSIVLDDAPGPERIFALFSAEPLASEQVLARLRALHAAGPATVRATRALPVPADTVQISIVIEKGPNGR